MTIITTQTDTVTGASSFNPFSRDPLRYHIMERNMARARYAFSHWVKGGALYTFDKVLDK